MGITISSKNRSISIGEGGFARLRKAVADMTVPEISSHYEKIATGEYFQMTESDFEEHDRETDELFKKYQKQYGKVIAFLYAPDTGASMPYGCAKQILRAIGERTDKDDMVIGYAGWGEKAARFRDFKEILKDAVETKKGFRWY